MRKIFLFISLFFFTLILINKVEAQSIPCNRNGNILSVSPNVITPGDRVTIIGNGFGKRINESSGWILARLVMDSDNALGDKRIVVPDTLILSWSDSQIIFTAPDFSLFRDLFELEDPQRASKNPTGVISISFDSLAGGGYLCASPFNNATFLLATKCTADLFGDFGEWSSCSENGFQTRQRKILADCPNISTEVPVETRVCTPTCTSWAYSNWSSCSSQAIQNRTIISSLPNGCVGGNSVLTQSCIYIPPSCTSWTYSGWSSCSASGQQTRTIISSSPSGCTGGSPALSQSCTYVLPACTSESWSCDSWSTCSSSGQQTRACNKISNCEGGALAPATTQSCTPACTSWTYTDWSPSECTASGGTQRRSIISAYPTGCVGGLPFLYKGCPSTACYSSDWSCSNWTTCSQNGSQTRTCEKIINCYGEKPATTQSCVYIPVCTQSSWFCSDWSSCSSRGTQTRNCNKTSNCQGGVSSPATSQSCTYTPPCSTDTWECGGWGTCSPQGVQTRSCTRTYDCPSAETAAPATSQYCIAPNRPQQQTPTEDLGIVNQSSIIKSTVKLICPVNSTTASQGSGTVINSTGLILTNKHVIDGTAGCWVGFIDNYDDEPYFGDRQIADIHKVSSDADVAVLKLRNPNNKTLTSINISQSNSSSIKLGEILTTYGYPAKFGTKITYTSGDFSGVDGNYLKTTAIIEHGNSGGGAYLKNGTFIGIPTAVVKGSLNSMGYLLSVNKVNSWLNNSIAYNYNNNNNYSRVSALLEDMDLNAISSLGLFVAGDEANIKTETESQKVIAEEKKLLTKIDNSLSKRMNGNILLQVEKNGEGWYVNPDNTKKYYLGRPADAFSIMRNLGLGIKHSELAGYLNSKFPSRLSGKIVLDVEKNGEAYYINPKDLKGYFLSRPADAFKVMRELGLGITNNDIRKIDIGEIN